MILGGDGTILAIPTRASYKLTPTGGLERLLF